VKSVSPAAAYVALIPLLTEAAREVGYALAVHGTMGRDLDLVAIPWTEEAGTAEQLILRLLSASGGYLPAERPEGDGTAKGDVAAQRPHGRRAWSLYFGDKPYADVSVMPLAPKPAVKA
jgi:hypothetical protein